jgi:hypothetical protein
MFLNAVVSASVYPGVLFQFVLGLERSVEIVKAIHNQKKSTTYQELWVLHSCHPSRRPASLRQVRADVLRSDDSIHFWRRESTKDMGDKMVSWNRQGSYLEVLARIDNVRCNYITMLEF